MKKTNQPKPQICSICHRNYTGFGNNAYPVNQGRCCDVCNTLVIAARINRLFRFHEVKENIKASIGK